MVKVPSHKFHVFMDRQLFGRSFRRLHKALDKPYAVFGRKHRIFFHDYWSAIEVAKRICPGDPTAIQAATIHVYLDEQCSTDRNFHKFLKWQSEEDARQRKLTRKNRLSGQKRQSSPKELKQLRKICKKLIEIRELHRIIHS